MGGIYQYFSNNYLGEYANSIVLRGLINSGALQHAAIFQKAINLAKSMTDDDQHTFFASRLSANRLLDKSGSEEIKDIEEKLKNLTDQFYELERDQKNLMYIIELYVSPLRILGVSQETYASELKKISSLVPDLKKQKKAKEDEILRLKKFFKRKN